jgi:hypothetical protein
VGVLSALALAGFRRIAIEGFGASEEWADLVTLIAGTATLVLPYSTVFNNHSVSGALILLGMSPLLLPKSPATADVVRAGILLSLAGAIDLTCFLFAPFALALFARRSPAAAMIFAAACLPLTLLYISFNILCSGSVLPPAMNVALWQYPGSEFGAATLSGLAKHSGISDAAVYAFHMLLGRRGLFSHTPVLIGSVAGLVCLMRGATHFERRVDFAWMLAACLSFMALYLFRSTNYSGWAFGVRWFATPMLILCVPLIGLESKLRASRRARVVFFGLVGVSAVLSLLGTAAPWAPDPTADTHVGFPSNSLVTATQVLIASSAADQMRFLAGSIVVIVVLGAASTRWLTRAPASSSSDWLKQRPPTATREFTVRMKGISR